MLRRLLVILLPAVFALVAAVAVPIGAALAHQETQRLYVDRLGDAGRFASLARTALETGRLDALDQELGRYQELYGVTAAVVAPDGRVVAASDASAGSGDPLARPATRRAMVHALAGVRPDPPAAVWPWSADPLVVAEPIGRDSEVAGAVVLVSPTQGLGARVLRGWGWLALASLVPLVLLALAAWPLSRWVLRPVRRLDAAATAISSGDLTVRADAAGGPPELRRLAGSFNTMVDVVERALERQRAFVSDASHQLRNPLASLRLSVENLRPFLNGPESRAAHDEAVEETAALHRMLNSLLAATRLESLTGTEQVEPAEVIGTRVQRWRALGGQRGVTVHTRVPGGVRVTAPAGGLGNVLDELVGNALRLSGGTRVVVWADPADPAEPDGPVEIHVGDDGAGLSEDERAQALRRFWRFPRHQNTEGTGLGLAICADLVRGAGGTLRLEAGLPRPDGTGRGLDAVISLPAAARRAPTPASGPGTTAPRRDAAARPRWRSRYGR